MGKDTVVQSAGQRSSVQRQAKEIQSVVIRRWRFRNLNPSLHQIKSNRRRNLIKERAFDLEREALKASGITEEYQIYSYQNKLDLLYNRILSEIIVPSDQIIKARNLFVFLWKEKPHRYKSHGPYRLNEVIDAQLSPNSETVGNCLGLTLLYNCLLKRMGIEVEALYLEHAFGIGPHVLSIININGSWIDIENILPDGFDYKGHLNNPSRKLWGDRELVSDIYHSLANEFFLKNDFEKALKYYDIAIDLNPEYEKAHLNKVILLDRMKMDGRLKRT